MNIERIATLEAVCAAAEALLGHFSLGYWDTVNRRGSDKLRQAIAHAREAKQRDPLLRLDLQDRDTLMTIRREAQTEAENTFDQNRERAYQRLADAADCLDAYRARSEMD